MKDNHVREKPGESRRKFILQFRDAYRAGCFCFSGFFLNALFLVHDGGERARTFVSSLPSRLLGMGRAHGPMTEEERPFCEGNVLAYRFCDDASALPFQSFSS